MTDCSSIKVLCVLLLLLCYDEEYLLKVSILNASIDIDDEGMMMKVLLCEVLNDCIIIVVSIASVFCDTLVLL